MGKRLPVIFSDPISCEYLYILPFDSKCCPGTHKDCSVAHRNRTCTVVAFLKSAELRILEYIWPKGFDKGSETRTYPPRAAVRMTSGDAHELVWRITNQQPGVDSGDCNRDHRLHHRPKSGLSKKGKASFQSELHVHVRCYLRAKHTTS